MSPEPWRAVGRCPGNPGAHLVVERGDVALVQERGGMHEHVVGIGEVPVPIARRRTEHVGQHPGVGTERVGVELQTLERRQDLEEHEPLRVGGMHQHIEVAVAPSQRRAEVGGVPGHVVRDDRYPQSGEPLGVPSPQGPAVPGRRTVLRRRSPKVAPSAV